MLHSPVAAGGETGDGLFAFPGPQQRAAVLHGAEPSGEGGRAHLVLRICSVPPMLACIAHLVLTGNCEVEVF